MATASEEKNAATTHPPSLYNIQYPNSRRGMFSLRYPFKEVEKVETIPAIDPPVVPKTSTPTVVPPPSAKAEHASPKRAASLRPLIVPRQVSKRNAHIQCSLLLPNIRHEMAVQTTIDREYSSDDSDLTPRYPSRRRLPPIQSPEEIYELWEIDSTRSLELIPIEPRHESLVRSSRHRRAMRDYDEEMESEDEHEHLVRARPAVKKTYLPPNVRMLCIRDNDNRTSH